MILDEVSPFREDMNGFRLIVELDRYM